MPLLAQSESSAQSGSASALLDFRLVRVVSGRNLSDSLERRAFLPPRDPVFGGILRFRLRVTARVAISAANAPIFGKDIPTRTHFFSHTGHSAILRQHTLSLHLVYLRAYGKQLQGTAARMHRVLFSLLSDITKFDASKVSRNGASEREIRRPLQLYSRHSHVPPASYCFASSDKRAASI